MSDNLNDRIENSIHGPKDLNIDEKNQYLGNLRERVYLSVSSSELNDKKLMSVFFAHFKDYAPYQIYLNGHLQSNPVMNKIIADCAKTNTKFSIVTKENYHIDIAILVVANTAINEPVIDIKEKYKEN